MHRNPWWMEKWLVLLSLCATTMNFSHWSRHLSLYGFTSTILLWLFWRISGAFALFSPSTSIIIVLASDRSLLFRSLLQFWISNNCDHFSFAVILRIENVFYVRIQPPTTAKDLHNVGAGIASSLNHSFDICSDWYGRYDNTPNAIVLCQRSCHQKFEFDASKVGIW